MEISIPYVHLIGNNDAMTYFWKFSLHFWTKITSDIWSSWWMENDASLDPLPPWNGNFHSFSIISPLTASLRPDTTERPCGCRRGRAGPTSHTAMRCGAQRGVSLTSTFSYPPSSCTQESQTSPTVGYTKEVSVISLYSSLHFKEYYFNFNILLKGSITPYNDWFSY